MLEFSVSEPLLLHCGFYFFPVVSLLLLCWLGTTFCATAAGDMTLVPTYGGASQLVEIRSVSRNSFSSFFSNVLPVILATSFHFLPAPFELPKDWFPLWWTHEVFHPRYARDKSFEDSRLERVGEWVTTTIGDTRDIYVLPAEGSSSADRRKLAAEPDFAMTESGVIRRLHSRRINPDFSVKPFCLPYVVIAYRGAEPNFEQSMTLSDLASYARLTGKHLHLEGRPLVGWIKPVMPSQGTRWYEPYQFDVEPGLTLLPEGVLTTTRIARLLRETEIELGSNIDVTSAIRSSKRQGLLFDQLKSSQPVARPGRSYHEIHRGGIAIDVSNWREAKPLLERRGFLHGEPGIGELPLDPWHFVHVESMDEY